MMLEGVAALWPLALGHDQEASACPWANLTRRTTDYPSRRAQLALAVASGLAATSADVVEALYRCDDCGLCQAWSVLPEAPDLAGSLWPVRAMLAAQGAVPELNALREALREHGHIYGDLTQQWVSLLPSDAAADTLFVPDGAVLAHHPEAARAAFAVAVGLAGPVALDRRLADSGQVLLELGLAREAAEAQAVVREHVAGSKLRRVLAGTPKEAAALASILDSLPCEVAYAGTALAQAVMRERLAGPARLADGRRTVLHASSALLRDEGGHAVLEDWLAGWLGGSFRREPDARRYAWPAAVERPAIGLNPALARRLAAGRMEQLMRFQPELILTCDPYSYRALQAAAPPGVEVQDLLVFAGQHWTEA
jgi:hypothetical protein